MIITKEVSAPTQKAPKVSANVEKSLQSIKQVVTKAIKEASTRTTCPVRLARIARTKSALRKKATEFFQTNLGLAILKQIEVSSKETVKDFVVHKMLGQADTRAAVKSNIVNLTVGRANALQSKVDAKVFNTVVKKIKAKIA